MEDITQKCGDIHADWAKNFTAAFANTLLTTVKKQNDGTTFLLTGDIPAMWLRDSTAQVRPYLVIAKEDEELADMISGLVKKQFFYINIDPYANAFNEEANGAGHQTDHTKMNDWIWERKYEIDCDYVCNFQSADWRYVLGADWKSKLQIPKGYAWKTLALYPDRHEYWIYHLLLAKQGKIDIFITSNGYGIGGIHSKDMCVRFAECIEGRLLNAGAKGIRLALELDNLCCGRRRTTTELCGGYIKIESLCHYPTHRLWADYIQK